MGERALEVTSHALEFAIGILRIGLFREQSDVTIHGRKGLVEVTVTRLDVTFDHGGISVQNAVTIGSGYGFGPDTAAVVVGPAGLAYDQLRDTLYVASEMDDTIFALHNAGKTKSNLGTGTVVYRDATHLHGPLGLIFVPNGDLLVANTGTGQISAFDPSTGNFVAKLDDQIGVLHESMAEAASDHVRLGELNGELQELLERKESLEEAWLAVAEE